VYELVNKKLLDLFVKTYIFMKKFKRFDILPLPSGYTLSPINLV
jgi:hypothetical protein